MEPTLGYKIGEISTTPEATAGTVIRNIITTAYPYLRDYIYVKAAENITALNFVKGGVTIALAYSVSHTTEITDGVMGCAHIAITSGYYGWIVRAGLVAGANVATASTAGKPLSATATDGRLALYAAADTTVPVVFALTDASSNAADVILRRNN